MKVEMKVKDFRIRANIKGQGIYVLLDKDMSPFLQVSSRADFDSINFYIFSSEGTITDDAGV